MNYETRLDLQTAPGALDGDVEGAALRVRRRRIVIVILVAAALIAIAGAMIASSGAEEEFAPTEEIAPTITVVTPGNGTVAGIINATGTLAARREIQVGVVGEGGRVVRVAVEAGDWVRAGQVMAVIDRSVQVEQAASSNAQIDVARADAELAQANLDRALQLVDRGFISQANVDQLTATRDAAQARVKVAEAQYRELLARNDRLNIVAPHGGLVLTRNVEVGQVVAAGGDALFTIAQEGQMELLAQLGETDLARLSTGATATVIPVGTDKEFVGRIWQKAPTINEQTRQGTARIALPYAPELRPGGFASVRINSGAVVAPILPESAILSDAQGSYVFIVGEDNKVVRRPVEIGIVTERGITINSGLTGRERIVVRAGGFLSEGDTIRPVKQAEAG